MNAYIGCLFIMNYNSKNERFGRVLMSIEYIDRGDKLIQ